MNQLGLKTRDFPFPGALLQLAESILMVSTPLLYMAFPPTEPEVAALLEKGEDGFVRPKAREESSGFNWSMMITGLWDLAVLSCCLY